MAFQPTKEDIRWYKGWSRVLVKVRAGSTSDTNTEFSRQEMADLLRGLRLLQASAKPEDRDG